MQCDNNISWIKLLLVSDCDSLGDTSAVNSGQYFGSAENMWQFCSNNIKVGSHETKTI